MPGLQPALTTADPLIDATDAALVEKARRDPVHFATIYRRYLEGIY